MRSMTPVRGRTLGGLALAAVAALAIGCGDDDDDSGDSGETATADSYVSAVCTAFSDLGQVLTEGQAELAQLSTASPEEGKDALVGFIGDAVGAVESARGEIEGAGVPDVEGGDEVASTLNTALTDLQTTFEEAQASAEDLTVDSPQAFASEAQEIGTAVTEATGEIGAGLQEIGTNEELETAAAEAEACQSVS